MLYNAIEDFLSCVLDINYRTYKTIESLVDLGGNMISIGSDHAGFALKEHVINYLSDKGYKVNDLGPDMAVSVHYPIYGEVVANNVAIGDSEFGIVICGTGIGISMSAANVRGIRCALCTNSYMAKMARAHNDANVLALGSRVVGTGLAEEIIDTFINTSFEGGRHAVRVAMINDIDDKRGR